MRKPVLILVFLIVLLFVSVAPVHASVSVNSTIGDTIYITYNFENLDPAIYNEMIASPQLFNGSTIPKVIVKNFKDQGLTRVSYGFKPNVYDNATDTIRVSFFLGGSDIISFTLNRTTMRRTYQVRTDWREFQVNLTSSFPINFTQAITKPVAEWQKIGETTYFFQSEENSSLDISFKIALPETATQVQAEGDTITYEVPPYFEDAFLNSPFLILAVFIVVVIIALIYRKVR